MKFQGFMQKSLLMKLYQDYNKFFLSLTKDLKSLDMNLNDSLILLAVFFENTKMTNPKELNRVLMLPKDQISQSLKRLQTKKLVTRKIDLKDERMRIVSITALGRKKASKLVKIFDQEEKVYEESLS